jgi:adenylylsulfate kinase
LASPEQVNNTGTDGERRARGFVVWMTGLPAAGKSTLAKLLQKRLLDGSSSNSGSRYVEILDGDEIRRGLSRDLGMSKEDREEHARRVSFLAKVLARNDVISIVALISPYRKSREEARETIGRDRFVEVYVKASLNTCEKRDPKGLYAKARRGEINNMTGIQDPYEEPENPDIVIDTEKLGPEECADMLIKELRRLGYLQSNGR